MNNIDLNNLSNKLHAIGKYIIVQKSNIIQNTGFFIGSEAHPHATWGIVKFTADNESIKVNDTILFLFSVAKPLMYTDGFSTDEYLIKIDDVIARLS